jgi:hypothetical protein
MKQLMFSIPFLLPIVAWAQITLDHTYPNAGHYGATNNWQLLKLVNLELAGEKFVFIDNSQRMVKLYHLDHSLWQTISFDAAVNLQANYNNAYILYISQHLFDLDDEIEFLLCENGDDNTSATQVVNEDGSIQFTAMDQVPRLNPSVPQEQVPIYTTVEGTFMILSGGNATDGNAYVYRLPGTLATGMSPGPIHELATLSAGMAYPNPTANTTRIDYALPTGVNEGFIVLYTTGGQEVKRFRIDRTFNTLEITTYDLQSGTYYYNLQTTQGVSGGNRLVTVR